MTLLSFCRRDAGWRRNADRDIETRGRDSDLAGLPNLVVIGHEARHRRAARERQTAAPILSGAPLRRRWKFSASTCMPRTARDDDARDCQRPALRLSRSPLAERGEPSGKTAPMRACRRCARLSVGSDAGNPCAATVMTFPPPSLHRRHAVAGVDWRANECRA